MARRACRGTDDEGSDARAFVAAPGETPGAAVCLPTCDSTPPPGRPTRAEGSFSAPRPAPDGWRCVLVRLAVLLALAGCSGPDPCAAGTEWAAVLCR